MVENAGVENTGAKTYGKLSMHKFLTVETRIRMCLIANGQQSPISGQPNRTDWPGFWSRSHTLWCRVRLRGSKTQSLYSLVVFKLVFLSSSLTVWAVYVACVAYLFSHVYVFLHLLNYRSWNINIKLQYRLMLEIIDNKQSINMQKGRNESNELSSSNLIFFRNNLGLVFHTTYSCIFHACYLLLFFHSYIVHSCYLLLLFPLLYFPPVRSTPAFSTPAFTALTILTVSHFSNPA